MSPASKQPIFNTPMQLDIGYLLLYYIGIAPVSVLIVGLKSHISSLGGSS
jgi:hypothetical protein